jgi:SAM-dependent methyltransferase
MPNTAEIISFYNSILPQLATENGRHKRVYQSLDSLPKGKAIDIGCGSGLTSKRLADGGRDVIAIDFSPVAIKHAKQYNNSERIQYLCCDIFDFKTTEKFDTICLIDILEHLPDTNKLTELIQKISHADSVIYLNIPYGETIKYLKDNFPEVLQPVDEAKTVGKIINLFKNIDFIPFKMELYWMQYVEYFFCTKNKFNLFMDSTYQSLRRDANG